MGEEYEIEQFPDSDPNFIYEQLDPNSPFNDLKDLLSKEMEYLESTYLSQIEYLIEFSKFKVLKRLIIEQQYLVELMGDEDWSSILNNSNQRPLPEGTLKMLF